MNLGRFDCATGLVNVLRIEGDLTVRTASILDASLIDKLQRENSYAVGFIQRTIWDKYVFGGERNFFVLIIEANHDPGRLLPHHSRQGSGQSRPHPADCRS